MLTIVGTIAIVKIFDDSPLFLWRGGWDVLKFSDFEKDDTVYG